MNNILPAYSSGGTPVKAKAQPTNYRSAKKSVTTSILDLRNTLFRGRMMPVTVILCFALIWIVVLAVKVPSAQTPTNPQDEFKPPKPLKPRPPPVKNNITPKVVQQEPPPDQVEPPAENDDKEKKDAEEDSKKRPPPHPDEQHDDEERKSKHKPKEDEEEKEDNHKNKLEEQEEKPHKEAEGSEDKKQEQPKREERDEVHEADRWFPSIRLHTEGEPELVQKRAAIREMFLHGWKAYRQYAWGADELRPREKGGHNWMGGGLAATIVDSLSTMWVMGLKREFDEARDWCKEHLANKFEKAGAVSFFETTIRILGGLISAYDLSGDKLFLDLAKDIGDRLLPAFNTKSGYPLAVINLASGAGHRSPWAPGVILAEIGTVQLEFITLAKHLRDPKYARAALKVYDVVEKKPLERGMYTLYLDPDSGDFTGKQVSLGALGDSFYEYLLKMWVLTNHKVARFKRLYTDAAEAVLKNLLVTAGNYTYVTEWAGGNQVHKFDHLACFTGGMFALGAANLEGEVEQEDIPTRHMAAGKGITDTCHYMYSEFPNKISPESVHFSGETMRVASRYYILRPEAVESFMILWRLTKQPKFRDYGWEVVAAINATCRVENGFCGIRDVTVKPPELDDTMQSFFFAETLKYLYLLFSPDDHVDLTKFVFNTEAHPIRIYQEPYEDWKYLFETEP